MPAPDLRRVIRRLLTGWSYNYLALPRLASPEDSPG
jgi:hypothetical protein